MAKNKCGLRYGCRTRNPSNASPDFPLLNPGCLFSIKFPIFFFPTSPSSLEQIFLFRVCHLPDLPFGLSRRGYPYSPSPLLPSRTCRKIQTPDSHNRYWRRIQTLSTDLLPPTNSASLLSIQSGTASAAPSYSVRGTQISCNDDQRRDLHPNSRHKTSSSSDEVHNKDGEQHCENKLGDAIAAGREEFGFIALDTQITIAGCHIRRRVEHRDTRLNDSSSDVRVEGLMKNDRGILRSVKGEASSS
jgi:hypothetical protein